MLFKGFEMVDEQGQLLVKCDTGSELVKAHITGYANKKGTYIQAHDDKRQQLVAHDDKRQQLVAHENKIAPIHSDGGFFHSSYESIEREEKYKLRKQGKPIPYDMSPLVLSLAKLAYHEVAQHLIKHGHFDEKQAIRYLDSAYGRHLADDFSVVRRIDDATMKSSVADYKKDVAKYGNGYDDDDEY